MDWQPNTTQKTREKRAELLQQVRAFFQQRKVLEVETPILSRAGNTDPYIDSFNVINSSEIHYLHTSPEYAMKRLLADGSGDIYQICKVFRHAEKGRNHNPEFTMLEWYRVGFSYQQLMQEVETLLTGLIPNLQLVASKFSYQQVFLENLGFNPHTVENDAIKNLVKKTIPSLETDNLSRQAMLDALLTHTIEPTFAKDCLTFIYDYPASQSALATIRDEDNTQVAERFEVYLGTMELGNGYQEETNFEQNTRILHNENKQRDALGLKQVNIDNSFLHAIEAGMPDSSGVAIGLDRVLMCIIGEKSIQKVINFPWDKA